MTFLVSPYAFDESLLICDAADFDGVNDYLNSSGMTGASDSKLLSGVIWLYPDSVGAGVQVLMQEMQGGVQRGILQINNASGAFRVRFHETGGGTRLQMDSSSAVPTSGWTCIMFSVDMADTGKRHLYFGDTDEFGSAAFYIDDALDFTGDAWYVGANAAGGNKYAGGMAELWLAPGQYIDFSDEANRRKFFSATGKPVDVGTDGSTPTGTAPLIYLHLGDGDTADDFALNDGSSDDFSVNGALATFTPSPSD